MNVKGHTQITGALLATIDEEGKDRNQLTFNTGSLNFTDLRNIHQSTQTNAGLSANFGVGEGKTENPREGQPTAEGANGKTLYTNTSNLTYSNSQENSASKTLATLGHGNITVGGTQLEKDGELTEAGKAANSPLIGMNRDTGNTTKELWNSEQSQTVDAMLDHRLLTEDGRKQIAGDWDETKKGAVKAVDKTLDITENAAIAIKEYFGIKGELSDAEMADLAARADALGLKFSETGSVTSPPVFNEQEKQVLSELQQLEKEMRESNDPLYGSIDWAAVTKMAYDPKEGGPMAAVQALNDAIYQDDLNELANINELREQVKEVNRLALESEETVGQAGNIASGSSMFLRASNAIAEGLNAGLDSAKRLIKETDALTGHADDVVPNADNIAGDVKETPPPVKVDVDGEMVGQPYRFEPKSFEDGRKLTAEDINISHTNGMPTEFPPYKNGTVVEEFYLPPGTKIYSVEYSTQAVPGGWATPKQYSSLDEARAELALLPEFKNGDLVLREYTVINPAPVRQGTVGELTSANGKTYEGGGTQMEILFDRGSETNPKWEDFLSKLITYELNP